MSGRPAYRHALPPRSRARAGEPRPPGDGVRGRAGCRRPLPKPSINRPRATVPSDDGSGPALNDLITGQYDFLCDQIPHTIGHVEAGSIRVELTKPGQACEASGRDTDIPGAADDAVDNVEEDAFTRFWEEMEPISKRRQVIRRYEIGMSRRLYDAGFVSDTYFVETPEDRRIARERMRWWAAHRSTFPRTRAEVREWRERANEPWNPARSLADRVLDNARLPYVKIDTLRYDPYNLDAKRLLELCERRFPQRFEGVREFLEETAQYYPLRDTERLLPTPLALEPLFPRVRYSDAR